MNCRHCGIPESSLGWHESPDCPQLGVLFGGFTVAQHISATLTAHVKQADVTPALGEVYNQVLRNALVKVSEYIGRPLTAAEVKDGTDDFDTRRRANAETL